MLSLTALYHSFVIGTDLQYRLTLIRKYGRVIRAGIARDSGAYTSYLTFKCIPDELYTHFYNTQVRNLSPFLKDGPAWYIFLANKLTNFPRVYKLVRYLAGLLALPQKLPRPRLSDLNILLNRYAGAELLNADLVVDLARDLGTSEFARDGSCDRHVVMSIQCAASISGETPMVHVQTITTSYSGTTYIYDAEDVPPHVLQSALGAVMASHQLVQHFEYAHVCMEHVMASTHLHVSDTHWIRTFLDTFAGPIGFTNRVWGYKSVIDPDDIISEAFPFAADHESIVLSSHARSTPASRYDRFTRTSVMKAPTFLGIRARETRAIAIQLVQSLVHRHHIEEPETMASTAAWYTEATQPFTEPSQVPRTCTQLTLIEFLADCLMAATFWHTVEHDDRVCTAGKVPGFTSLNWCVSADGTMWTTNIRSLITDGLFDILAANDDTNWGKDCTLLTADADTNTLRIKFIDACRSDGQEFNTLNH